jgi:protein-tyrosine phosphatase
VDWIDARLAIGDVDDAVRINALADRGITGILCLNGFPNHAVNPLALAWRCVPLVDGSGNSLDRLCSAVRSLDELLEGHRVLVHCMEGISRSPLVVACYLCLKWNISLEEGIMFVRRRRRAAAIQRELLLLGRDYVRLIHG